MAEEAQLSLRDRSSAAHYTGGQVNELSAVGLMHRFETQYSPLQSTVTLKPEVGVIQGHWK